MLKVCCFHLLLTRTSPSIRGYSVDTRVSYLNLLESTSFVLLWTMISADLCVFITYFFLPLTLTFHCSLFHSYFLNFLCLTHRYSSYFLNISLFVRSIFGSVPCSSELLQELSIIFCSLNFFWAIMTSEILQVLIFVYQLLFPTYLYHICSWYLFELQMKTLENVLMSSFSWIHFVLLPINFLPSLTIFSIFSSQVDTPFDRFCLPHLPIYWL